MISKSPGRYARGFCLSGLSVEIAGKVSLGCDLEIPDKLIQCRNLLSFFFQKFFGTVPSIVPFVYFGSFFPKYYFKLLLTMGGVL